MIDPVRPAREAGGGALPPRVDLAVVGAGAAGMAAALFAAEAAAGGAEGARGRPAIALFDGARRPGAKILVSGGGRCNVTHDRVTPDDFCGGPRPIIRSVLRAFDERAARAWLERLGVALKLEPTGKWFPVSDSARTVLDALLRRLGELGVAIHAGARLDDLLRREATPAPGAGAADAFELRFADGARVRAARVILATGGLALPKSGSDGHGLRVARALGHTIVPTTPALVPLVLRADRATPGGRFAEFAGLTLDVALRLLEPTGRRVAECRGSFLFTHFGVSGPAVLDLSRHLLRWQFEHPDAPAPRVQAAFDGFADAAAADAWLRDEAVRHPRRTPAAALAERVPERLARALAPDGTPPFAQLGREARRALAAALGGLELPVVGDRGYAFAETTAGGVDLREVEAATMESRVVPGLHLCGEMLDVDGRLGGFNFQWAWSSGFVAGRGAVAGWAGAPRGA